ncbi:acyl-CoA oxidase [Aspergillus luchuensis]|uniref:Acyl-CoA oxidase n=1 Tax=Aspergillus kawachii TaxID=1069201 RepID=A0A146FUG6_ASPKA|nr:acyl-CoA oxidase [Aspergillus luchuensis]
MDGVRTAFAMVPCGVCTDNKFQDDEADVGVCYSWLDHHRKQLEHGDTVYGPMKSGERFATPAI